MTLKFSATIALPMIASLGTATGRSAGRRAFLMEIDPAYGTRRLLRAMEPDGLEPTTSCMPCKRSPGTDAEIAGSGDAVATVCTPVCTGDAKDDNRATVGASAASPDLAAVVEAWPTLPDAIKRAILAMIDASG